MKNKLWILMLGIFFVSFVSAIYAGECLDIDLSELKSLDNVVYDVVGNSSNLDGLTIDLNGTMANICTVVNYKPDNFTIIFIDNLTKTIIKEVLVFNSCNKCSKAKTIYDTIIKEIPNYITQWKDVEIIDLKTKDINTEDIEDTLPWWIYLVMIICILEIVFIVIIVSRTPKLNSKENNIVERRLKK